MNFDSAKFFEYLCQDLSSKKNDRISYIRAAVLRKTALKKFNYPQNRANLQKAAIDNFVKLNESIKPFHLSDLDDECLDIFNRCKSILYDSLMDLRYQSCSLTLNRAVQYSYTGPGKSIKSDFNNFVSKMFESPLSTTSLFLYKHYRSAISNSWLEAELIRHTALGVSIVEGSNISTVPKDAKRDRTICTEPLMNSFYQLGCKHILENALRKHHHIDVSTQQSINRDLALKGSIDAFLCTIDLKDASDSISLDLCRELLPREAFNTLCAVRSPKSRINGVYHDLKMISTMGNGFTFPLMTIILSSLVRAIYLHHNLSPKNGENYGVFGDDIIVTKDHYNQLVCMLEAFGFTVNVSKSFSTGFFRESCGGDFYKGQDIRGIYIKEINNEAQLYSAFNRLHFWSLRHNISLRRSLLYLKGLADFRPVPRHCGNHEGFIITQDHLTSPKYTGTGAVFYRPLVPITRRFKVGDVSRNPLGAFIGFLGGYVRNGFVSEPQKDFEESGTKYKIGKRASPCWDWSDTVEIPSLDLSISWALLLSK